MPYHFGHQRIKPVLDLARKLDIASNPSPQALFEAGNGSFQVWCIPQDRPRGWSEIPMHHPNPLPMCLLTIPPRKRYVVIVSSEFHPEAFCRPGYELVRTLSISNASLFPINILLRPESLGQDLDIEPDDGSLVEQCENSSISGISAI